MPITLKKCNRKSQSSTPLLSMRDPLHQFEEKRLGIEPKSKLVVSWAYEVSKNWHPSLLAHFDKKIQLPFLSFSILTLFLLLQIKVERWKYLMFLFPFWSQLVFLSPFWSWLQRDFFFQWHSSWSRTCWSSRISYYSKSRWNGLSSKQSFS